RFIVSTLPRPPGSPLFPYTTLFRSVRREGAGKPAYIYRTTPEAEALFPKPYDRVLAELLVVLEERHTPEQVEEWLREVGARLGRDRKSTRLNSSHVKISYAVFCLKK